MKTFTLTEYEMAICANALRCLDAEWGLDYDEEELLVELEVALED